MALAVLSFFNFIWNNFVQLYCDSCHIRVHFKQFIKIGNFCATILMLKMEENTEHFLAYYALLFQER